MRNYTNTSKSFGTTKTEIWKKESNEMEEDEEETKAMKSNNTIIRTEKN